MQPIHNTLAAMTDSVDRLDALIAFVFTVALVGSLAYLFQRFARLS